MASNNSPAADTVVPDEFIKVLTDFIIDLQNTFPEYTPLISKWWKSEPEYSYIENEEERKAAFDKGAKISAQIVFKFCQKKLPPRFFDILYQNNDIFSEDTEVDTEFLPHIHFKNLWQVDISDKTRETIWKYLQLIVFSIVGTLDNKDVFGDSAKLFETLNQEDFKEKLEETLLKMQDIFDNNKTDNCELGGNLNMEDLPKADDIHEHISSMLDGKLGKLAREIAEETAQNINIDMDNATDMKDVLSNLIKNPTKLMGLVQSVGSKLDTKLKSGEIKESELMSEATEIMNKMKNMQGMGDIQAMLGKLGLGGKVNTSAMEAQLERKLKLAKQKERMNAKVNATRLAKEKELSATNTFQQQQHKPPLTEDELIKLFSNDNQNKDTTAKSKKKKTKQ